MKTATIIIRGLAWIIITMLVIPPGISAQDIVEPEQNTEQTTEQTEKFKKEELDQMLAPIALYPDSLIAQMLMASTYPLEVVEAERWLRQNKHLKGDELDKAMQLKTWDPSVKSLCHFPDILFAMSDKLDQTRKLGDAFLSQQDDVMATIQELRQKAREQGNLKTTKEQQVIVEKEVIRIEPADTEVIYVPVYDPFYVYGPWWYPAYLPYYWYYPPGFVVTGGFIRFGPPVFIGIGFSWVWFDWPVRVIHIDIHKTRRFHRFDDRKRDFDKHIWKHDSRHRRGVAYRDKKTVERFGKRLPHLPMVPETRGYPGKGIEKQDLKPSQIPIERQKDTKKPRVKTEREKIQRAPDRDDAFKGIGSGNFERKASERGGISRQGEKIKRPSKDGGRKHVGDKEKGGTSDGSKGGKRMK